jgi:Holliday junction resolvase
MDAHSQDFARLFYEAIQQLGAGADSAAIIERVRRLQLGLPAEDEFSLILSALGRCRTVHKLDQFQSPRQSSKELQVPDLLAVFRHKDRDVPVLIEVKSEKEQTLSWRSDYKDALDAYARAVRLPLLVAWKHKTFWVLFEARHLRKAVTNFNINFADALRHTLMTELAGDFSFSLKPGCAMRLTIRKLSSDTGSGFRGRIERVRWVNGDGKEFENAPGVFPLFMCLDQDSLLEEDGDLFVQSFVIPDEPRSEFAHRALGTLLRVSLGSDDPHWRELLQRPALPKMAQVDFRAAANQALEMGFLRYGINIVPSEMPAFLADRV